MGTTATLDFGKRLEKVSFIISLPFNSSDPILSNAILGVLFGLFRGMLLIVVIYLVLPAEFKQSKFISESQSSTYLKKYAPMAEKFFKSMISDKNSVMLKSDISTIYETT